jgi:hypothetical protein
MVLILIASVWTVTPPELRKPVNLPCPLCSMSASAADQPAKAAAFSSLLPRHGDPVSPAQAVAMAAGAAILLGVLSTRQQPAASSG